PAAVGGRARAQRRRDDKRQCPPQWTIAGNVDVHDALLSGAARSRPAVTTPTDYARCCTSLVSAGCAIACRNTDDGSSRTATVPIRPDCRTHGADFTRRLRQAGVRDSPRTPHATDETG